jgi:hypothetical protein
VRKLTKHKRFKSEEKPGNLNSAKNKKLMMEFEAFLNQLQRQFSSKMKVKITNGKKSN